MVGGLSAKFATIVKRGRGGAGGARGRVRGRGRGRGGGVKAGNQTVSWAHSQFSLAHHVVARLS